MRLSGTDITGAAVNLITTTATGTGLYNFNVPPGTYTVEVTAGIHPLLLPAYDLDGIATPNRAVVTVLPGQDRLDVDFGYRASGSIGDRIWHDTTLNHIQNPGEPGIPGVTVTLTSKAQGNAATTTTDTDGRFVFAIVRPDTYSLQVTLQGFKTLEPTNVVVSANDRLFLKSLRIAPDEIPEVKS